MKPGDDCVINYSVRELRLILEKALELGYEANSEGQSIEQATVRLGELMDDAFLHGASDRLDFLVHALPRGFLLADFVDPGVQIRSIARIGPKLILLQCDWRISAAMRKI